MLWSQFADFLQQFALLLAARTEFRAAGQQGMPGNATATAANP
jgi:hypothetical protein